MKVFLGLLLLAGATFALVDEKEPTLAVPESKKTDLLITANGHTIKVNTDGKGPNAINVAANRFKVGASRTRRRMQGDDEDHYDDGQGGSDNGEDGYSQGGNDGHEDEYSQGSGDGDQTNGGSSSGNDNAISGQSGHTYNRPEGADHGAHGHQDYITADDVGSMVQDLEGKIAPVDGAQPDTVSLSRARVEDIIAMLSGFEEDLRADASVDGSAGGSGYDDDNYGSGSDEDNDDGYGDYEDERRRRRRRNRRQNVRPHYVAHHLHRHAGQNRNRRQSVVHRASHFVHHQAHRVQRVVVNP